MHRILIAALALGLTVPAVSAPTRNCPKGYIQDREPPFKCVPGYRHDPFPHRPPDEWVIDEEAFEKEVHRLLHGRRPNSNERR